MKATTKDTNATNAAPSGATNLTTNPMAAASGSAPGSNPPPALTAAQVAAFEAACNTLALLLGTYGNALSLADVKRLSKPKRNPSAWVNGIVDLSAKFNIVSTSRPLGVAIENEAFAETLAPAVSAVANLEKVLKDALFLAQSIACSTASATYHALSGQAKSNPVLANALQPLRAQLRPKLVTPEGTTTVKRARSASGIAKAKKLAAPSPVTAGVTPPVVSATVGHS